MDNEPRIKREDETVPELPPQNIPEQITITTPTIRREDETVPELPPDRKTEDIVINEPTIKDDEPPPKKDDPEIIKQITDITTPKRRRPDTDIPKPALKSPDHGNYAEIGYPNKVSHHEYVEVITDLHTNAVEIIALAKTTNPTVESRSRIPPPKEVKLAGNRVYDTRNPSRLRSEHLPERNRIAQTRFKTPRPTTRRRRSSAPNPFMARRGRRY